MIGIRFAYYGLVSLVIAGISAEVLVLNQAQAKTIKLVPSSDHSILTMNTDGSFGYLVYPSKPLKIDLIGPGSLTISVRLNAKNKRMSLSGQFEIRRGKRRIKSIQLKLIRSRVGAYKEDPGLILSLPKVVRLQAPMGIQSYTFSLRSARGISMTLYLTYDSDEDQAAARKEEETLALVPLIPTNETESHTLSEEDPNALTLVPLDSTIAMNAGEDPGIKSPKDRSDLAKSNDNRQKSEHKEETKPFEVAETKTTTRNKTSSASENSQKLAALQDTFKIKKTKESQQAVEDRTITKTHLVSLGLKAGQISPFPFPEVAGTNYIISLDLRYILPVFKERLSLGIEGAYYAFDKTTNFPGESRVDNYTISIIPISFQLFYRIPLGAVLEPFVGGGGDVFICIGESKVNNVVRSGNWIAFGGHINAGIEISLGPGFIMIEARLAGSIGGESQVALQDASMSGISTVAGYRFVF